MTSTLPNASVHVLAKSFTYWADADKALRRYADALSRPVTAWEVRECRTCPRRPIHIYPRGSNNPVTWADISRAGAGSNPPSRSSRAGARRG